jgi:hypothetical protein
MTVTVREKWESRKTREGKDPSIELVYLIDGTDDDLTAKAALIAELSSTYDGLWLAGIEDLYRIGQNAWVGMARYGYANVRTIDVGESEYSFDTTGGTAHITQSLRTMGSYAAPDETAPDFKGAINVTRDSVEGVDNTVPSGAFTERHILAATAVTQSYQKLLRAMTGKVNLGTFRGRAEGEVKFLGARGSQRGSDDWDLSFHFEDIPNVYGLKVGDITGITKRGHDYLWVYYVESEDTTAKRAIKKPIAAYVEEVAELRPFALLGIGTT